MLNGIIVARITVSVPSASFGLYRYALETGRASAAWRLKPAYCNSTSSNGFNASTSSQSQATWQPNKWYFVAGTFSGGTITTYINGVQDGSNATGQGRKAGTFASHFWIGGEASIGDGITPFNGVIDDPRVYNRALTAAEVNKLYHLGWVTGKQ